MFKIIRRDLLKGAAAVAAQSAIWQVAPAFGAAHRRRVPITNYPTLLGAGGHSASATQPDSYAAGKTYYGNVGLGRCAMKTGGVTTQARSSQSIQVDGTISNLWWGLDTAFGAALTFSLNKNTIGSGLGVAFGPAITGWRSDSSSVSVSAGDALNFAAYVGAGNTSYTGAFNCASMQFNSTDSTIASAQMIASVGSSAVVGSGQRKYVNFLGILGSDTDADTNELNQQYYCVATGEPAGVWQNMACYIDQNGFVGTTIINNRISQNDGSMSISILGGQTGGFEASSADYDNVNNSDLLCYQFSLPVEPDASIGVEWVGAHFYATNNPAECMVGGAPNDPSTQDEVIGGQQVIYSPIFGGGEYGTSATRSTGTLPYDARASSLISHITSWTAGPGDSVTFDLVKDIDEQTGMGTVVLSNSVSFNNTGWMPPNTCSPGLCSHDFAAEDTCTHQIDTRSLGGQLNNVTWVGAAMLLTAN